MFTLHLRAMVIIHVSRKVIFFVFLPSSGSRMDLRKINEFPVITCFQPNELLRKHYNKNCPQNEKAV